MKILDVYIGTIAITKWRIKTVQNHDYIEIGNSIDTNNIIFRQTVTKENLLLYSNEFKRLEKNTTKYLSIFYENNKSTFEKIFRIFNNYDKIKLYFASGGLFSSNVVLNLLNHSNKEKVEIITSTIQLDLPFQNFVIEKLKNRIKDNKIIIVRLKSKNEELLSDYVLRLDNEVCSVIKKYRYRF